MKIQIAGTGCAKCGKLAQNVQSAVSDLKLDCEIEKVEDMDQIVALGILTTPALVVDGNIVSTGKVLSTVEIVKLLSPPVGGCGCGAPANAESAPKSCNCGGSCGAMAEEVPQPCACGCNCGAGIKKMLTVLLLLFALVSIAYVVYREVANKETVTPVTAVAPAAVAQTAPLTVYYFHGTKRCMTCNKIEELTRQAIAGKFAKELADGAVIFMSVNVEDSANEHFIRDFDLTVRSVVMSKNGKFEKFDDVWTLVGDPAKFTAYVRDGAAKMMEGK